jgi:hypothetical protein
MGVCVTGGGGGGGGGDWGTGTVFATITITMKHTTRPKKNPKKNFQLCEGTGVSITIL